LGSAVTQEGVKLKCGQGHHGDWDAWPLRLRVRQMPKIRLPRRRSKQAESSVGSS
jgi:hypothetical protein